MVVVACLHMADMRSPRERPTASVAEKTLLAAKRSVEVIICSGTPGRHAMIALRCDVVLGAAQRVLDA